MPLTSEGRFRIVVEAVSTAQRLKDSPYCSTAEQ
jgi:hypothetical protein